MMRLRVLARNCGPSTPAQWGAALMLALLAAGLPARPARAQGVTSSAVTGVVTGEDGRPLPGMQVIVRQTQTGVQTGTLTRQDGRYYLEGLLPGGPYTIRVEGIGHAPKEQAGIYLVLSQTGRYDFSLAEQAVEIAGLVVTGDRSGIFTASHTGPATTVDDSVLQRMPTLTRNFTDLVRISPFVTTGNGPSVAGENNRFNNIEIDGAVDNDLFGLGSTGTPGGQVNAKPISMDAIAQFQVLSAPFDVRQGGFTGGLVNAVTKSGTNKLQGSAFFFGRNQSFTGEQAVFGAGGTVARKAMTEFKNQQFGFSLGGPIVKDRIHFFVNWEGEQFNRPSTAPAIGRDAFAQVGVAADSAARFQQILQNTYHLTPGDVGAMQQNNPKYNAFGRLDFQLGARHRLTIRDSYAQAQDDNPGTRSTSFYSLTSNFYLIRNHSNSLVAELHSALSDALFNELLVNYELVRDRRNPELGVQYGEIDVKNTSAVDTSADHSGQFASATRTLRAGGEFFSQANQLDQDLVEVTDNLTLTHGIHKITVGSHNEFFKFRNVFDQNIWGNWNFNSLADFEADRPASYTINYPYGGQSLNDITARFSVYQLGGYVQDEMSFGDRFDLSVGLRVDAPIFPDKPRDNPVFRDSFGISTSTLPRTAPLFSPRLGFNWDVTGDGATRLRGGAGLFTGRPPYVWLSNSYVNTGRELVGLTCSGAAGAANAPPSFTGTFGPPQCAGGAAGSAGAAVVNIFDPSFKFPQDLKLSAGVDRRLPLGLTGSLEGLYSKAVHQIFVQEWNLKQNPDGSLAVVDHDIHGRPLYGTFNPATGAATPNRKTSGGFNQVVRLTNANDDYSYNLTASLERRFSDLLELEAGYTYGHSYDTQSLTSSIATSNYGFNPISGDPNAPPLAPSNWDIPHKLTFTASSVPIHSPRFGSTRLALIYTAQSGYDYSYTYNGDVNGDGYQAPNISGRNNDLVYVPKDASDILLKPITDRSGNVTSSAAQQWTALNAFISGESCLSRNRGRILPRNACREPWHNRIDGRVIQTVPTVKGEHFQIVLDVFNIPNLIRRSWGVYEVANNSTINLLNLAGWDPTTKQGIYQFPGSFNRFTLLNPQSQWQIQLGGKYSF